MENGKYLGDLGLGQIPNPQIITGFNIVFKM